MLNFFTNAKVIVCVWVIFIYRCFELIEPFKADSKAIDALNALFARIRQLLLDSYSHHVMHFEEYMRSERENRTATGWSYWSYFLLQVQLFYLTPLCLLIQVIDSWKLQNRS